MTFFSIVIKLLKAFNVAFFRRGGAKSVANIDSGGQNPYILLNSQYYHYSFFPREGPNSTVNFDGGAMAGLAPWISHWLQEQHILSAVTA